MSDWPSRVQAIREHIDFYGVQSDERGWMAGALRELLERLDAAERRAEEAERALERIREAWSKSWDCSADPGHRLMNEALAPSRPSATEEEK